MEEWHLIIEEQKFARSGLKLECEALRSSTGMLVPSVTRLLGAAARAQRASIR